jgi:hypothetical protein
MSTTTSTVGPAPRPPKPTVTYREGWHERIPAELKGRAQWVAWRYEWNGTKWTKVPYCAKRPTTKASSTKAATWCDFADALISFNHYRDSEYYAPFDGIGFVFSADDEYTGVDLDHCLDADGSVLDWAEPYLARFRPGYGEISPSGRGIKIIVRGVLPGKGSKKTGLGPNGAAVEMYDRGRYFTITGDAVEGTPDVIPDLGDVITATHRQLFPPPEAKATTKARADTGGIAPDDETLLAKARAAKNGDKFSALFDHGDLSGHDGDQSRADFALCGMLAFWWNGDAAAVDRMFRRSALMRDKWDESAGAQSYGQLTITKAIETKSEFYTPPIRTPKLKPAGGKGKGGGKPPEEGGPVAPADGRPPIEISPERHEVADAAVEAITRDPRLFCRGESLVIVATEENESVKLTAKTSLKRMAGSPKIVELSDSNVGCMLTRNAEFFRWQKDENGEDIDVQVHPPDWCIKAVATRKFWPGVRRLVAVVECPYPRADGSIVETPGYDPETGTLYIPSMDFLPVPENPTQEEAKAAAKTISEVFKEFPLASDDDRVVPLAALLTVIARPAIDGSVPGFAFNGNRAGTGKGLLINAIGRIAYGRDVATSNYPDDKIEAQKVKVSIALQAPIAVHFDNLDEGTFYGNSALDSMITAGSINDRILGSSKHTGELPVRVVPMLSGNNVSPGKDAHRRWLVCNLRTELERPEERKDLEIKDLRAHVSGRRGELVQAALTILKAHALARWPTCKEWAPLGSFEEWDKIVRGAVWFATGRDCCATRRKAADEAPARRAKIALLVGWSELPGGTEGGVTAKKAVDLATNNPPKYATLYNSLVYFGKAGKLADGRGIGNIIRGMKGCLTEGMKFVEGGIEHSATLWMVVKSVTDPLKPHDGGESGESGESVSVPPTRDFDSDNYVSEYACNVECCLERAEIHSPDSPDSPAEEERLGMLASHGMSISGIRQFLAGAKTHGGEIRDLLPRIIAGGMWRDFVLSGGERHRWGGDDFREFLEAPRTRGGCESSLPLIERLIGGTPAWAALQAVIAAGDDDIPTSPPVAEQLVGNGEAIRKLRTALSLAGYSQNIPGMFLRMVQEGSWRKYLTRAAGDEIEIYRRGAADFREFIESPWPGGLGSSTDVLDRVLRDTEAWPVYQGLIERDGGLA